MKRQRNTQKVKEHEKCPPSQTKEEIGNLPEKEFRIMIIKMIQNLENKMELQMNNLEARIEKMQEMFNKDLEEIKNHQLKVNNAINEIKHRNLSKMKRQRNTQQLKKHEKCLPSQRKEEEIGNLSEKEFRIMIIKMIQNLENKVELQINNLETRTEQMQEMFNKDLEEIKKSIENE